MIESKYLNQINELLNFLKETSKEDPIYKTYTSKLAKYRNKLTNEIYKTDIKKNKLNQKIYLTNLEIKQIEEINLLIKDSSSLEKEINSQFEIKQNLEKALNLAKKENKNYDLILSELIIENQKYKKLLKRQNKILKSNLTKNEQLKNDLSNQEINFQKEFENILVQIQNQLDLLDKIDSIFKTKTIEQNDLSFSIKNLNIFYGEKQAIFDLSIDFPKNKVIALIGPSGCGKSTLLRTLNRINDKIPGFRAEGKILYENKYDIYKLKSIENKYDKLNINELRTKVGMIFQQPNPFPMSIYKNVAYGPKINGIKNKAILNELVENSLKDAVLWDDVKNNLNVIGTSLSGGQQQRLCIARAIANKPKVLLMDEPTSALDPIAAAKIEELILKLKEEYTIIIVTHSMQQAARVSDYTAFMYSGKLIEYDKTSIFFSNPKEKKTDDYIRGKFG